MEGDDWWGHGVSGSRETRRRERVDAGVWGHVGSEGGSDAHAALSARGWAAGVGRWLGLAGKEASWAAGKGWIAGKGWVGPSAGKGEGEGLGRFGAGLGFLFSGCSTPFSISILVNSNIFEFKFKFEFSLTLNQKNNAPA